MTVLHDGRPATVWQEPLRFVVFSASLRAASLNTHLARRAAQCIEQHGGRADLLGMEEFDAPSYDQDVEGSQGT